MIIPTKHEKLSENILVIGADLIEILKKEPFNAEDLYRKVLKIRDIHIDLFLDAVTFLWLSDIIDYREQVILLRAKE